MEEHALLEDLLPDLPGGVVDDFGAGAFDTEDFAEIARGLMREGEETPNWSDLELRTDKHSIHRIDETDGVKEYVVSNMR